jgi:hypothetical protein
MLVSLYNVRNKTMQVSGPDDKSASLYRVTECLYFVRWALRLWPDAFRFVATDDGVIQHGHNLENITTDRKGLKLSSAFMAKVKWHDVPGRYFLMNHRKGVDSSI